MKSAAAKTPFTVVSNPATQHAVDIQSQLNRPKKAVETIGAIRISDNERDQEVEEIIQVDPDLKRTRKRRSGAGLRIRQNRSGQSAQKIKRKPIELKPIDEIGYKKLFSAVLPFLPFEEVPTPIQLQCPTLSSKK